LSDEDPADVKVGLQDSDWQELKVAESGRRSEALHEAESLLMCCATLLLPTSPPIHYFFNLQLNVLAKYRERTVNVVLLV